MKRFNNSYAYKNRQGVLPISWEDFYSICKGLALAVAKYNPDIILGIARGGLYPGTLLSHLLQKEFYPIRITRRLEDQVIYDKPKWLIKPPKIVKNNRILIVDEICSEGVTIEMVKNELAKLGAKEVKSAVMYAHKQGKQIPDYIGVISDALIINPWDREILKEGKFIMHPEYEGALEQQNMMSRLPIEDMIKHPEKYEGKNAFEVQQEDKNRKKQ